ncbi:MAG: hypothetical protein R3E82_03725 [Pseudomonadales bacterium]
MAKSILVSTVIIVGLYVGLALLLHGPSSALLEFPLPFLAAVGGAVLFLAIVCGPDLGPSPNDAPRSKPPAPNEPVMMRHYFAHAKPLASHPWLAALT